jgi:hypothetical protein
MKYLLAIALLSSLTVSAIAQIAINESDYINYETVQANGTTDTALNPSVLLPIINQSGPNQTWDFTTASFNLAGRASYEFVPYSDTIIGATDSDFLSATFVQESPASIFNGLSIPSSNEFYKITGSGAWDLGGCSDSDGTPSDVLSLNPPVEILPFPLTYQTTWQSTSNEDDPDLPFNVTQTQIEVVDGYGTLILPNHSDNALRVKETFILNIEDSAQDLEIADTDYVYIFYTLDGYQARIGTAPTDTSANYTVPSSSAVNPQPIVASGLSVTLTQNPASSAGTNVIFTMPVSGSLQVELMDVLGRNVRMFENGFESAGEHSVPIDPKTLSYGTYFVRVQTDGASAMQKLVVQ